MKRPVPAPMVTQCFGCDRPRRCATLPVMAFGYTRPFCRQCIRRVMAATVPALLALKRQER